MAEFPDSADVFIPDKTVADPPCIPEDRLAEKTLESMRNPTGMELLSRLAYKGSKVTTILLDRVKGEEQPTSHRRVSTKLIPKELYDVGVGKRDILLTCSSGPHRKNTGVGIYSTPGDELLHESWHSHQIINHDNEDYEHLVNLGTMDRGDPALINKYAYDGSMAILIGHAQGDPYGGHFGEYKHCVTGITRWRSTAPYHVPEVTHRKDFIPVSGRSLMRTKFGKVGQYMERCTGKKFFCCDVVLDIKPRQIEINNGYVKVMQPHPWIMADKRTHVPWTERKHDVMILGMPQFFHYGEGMGINPIMLMQTTPAQAIRRKCITSDDCVIICSSLCNSYFRDELRSHTRETYDMSQHDFMNTLPDMDRYGKRSAANEEYIRKYRYYNVFRPFRGFSMISCDRVAEMSTSVIYLYGAQESGYAKGMGPKIRATIEEALTDAKKESTGQNLNILALPQTFKLGVTHPMTKDETHEGKGQEDREYTRHMYGQMV